MIRRPDGRSPTQQPGRVAAAVTGGPFVWVAVAVGAITACSSNDPTYFPGATLQSDGMGTVATTTLALRFRAPSAEQQRNLQTMSAQLGYDAPWLQQDHVHVEVRYTITNTGDGPGKFSLFVNGATEFTRFDFDAVAAAFAMAMEDPPPLGLTQVSNPPILEPGETIQGVLREDDFREASVDLDAMGRFMAPFVSVLLNRSEVSLGAPACTAGQPPDCGGLEMTPPKLQPPKAWLLPALWEITPRFTSDQPMTLQFLVRVRDDDGQLWEDGDAEFMPAPTTFTPMVMPAP